MKKTVRSTGNDGRVERREPRFLLIFFRGPARRKKGKKKKKKTRLQLRPVDVVGKRKGGAA